MVAVSVALWGVARATGSGWIIVVVSVAAAILATGTLLPALSITTARADLTAPADAVTGSPLALQVRFEGPACRVRGIEPPGEWHGIDPPADGTLTVVPQHRGEVREIELEIACAAPLGVLWWHRRRRIPLSSPCAVGPAPIAHEARPGDRGVGDAAAGQPSPGAGDLVRSARDYRAGDPVRLMHWPATARRGAPMVKELEQLGEPGLVVSVDLRGSAADQEVAAGRAVGLCEAAIAAGRRTWLVTVERGATVTEEVATLLQASRRLALAEARPPVPAPAHLSGIEHAVVTAWDEDSSPGGAGQTGGPGAAR